MVQETLLQYLQLKEKMVVMLIQAHLMLQVEVVVLQNVVTIIMLHQVQVKAEMEVMLLMLL